MSKMENKKNPAALEPSIEESPIGSYGTRWLNWMQENHKKLFRELKKSDTLTEVARSVDKCARDCLLFQQLYCNTGFHFPLPFFCEL
jgi:hypothetical protein